LQIVALALLAVGAGVSVVIQQALNADLRVSLGSASWAALSSYLVGSLTLAVVLLVLREPWVSTAAVAKSSAWSWTGGVFGTIYIVVSILLLPHLGAATVVALLVTGCSARSSSITMACSVSRHTRSTFSALPARRC